MHGGLSFEQCVTEIKKFQTFLLHLLVSCMSICLLVEYGAILSVIHRDINNRSSPQFAFSSSILEYGAEQIA